MIDANQWFSMGMALCVLGAQLQRRPAVQTVAVPAVAPAPASWRFMDFARDRGGAPAGWVRWRSTARCSGAQAAGG